MKRIIKSAPLLLLCFCLLTFLSSCNSEKHFDNGYETVYITPYGECYHEEDCRYLHDDYEEVTLEEAVNMGRRPCSVCFPEVPYQEYSNDEIDTESSEIVSISIVSVLIFLIISLVLSSFFKKKNKDANNNSISKENKKSNSFSKIITFLRCPIKNVDIDSFSAVATTISFLNMGAQIHFLNIKSLWGTAFYIIFIASYTILNICFPLICTTFLLAIEIYYFPHIDNYLIIFIIQIVFISVVLTLTAICNKIDTSESEKE